VFALPAITVILALRYPRARVVANRLLSWAVHLIRRIFRKPGIDPAALDELLQRLATIRLGWLSYAEVFGLAVANWLFDCACLACAIRATGQPVPWHGLARGAALTAAGMNAGPALGAVLAYRLVNFWMILLGGGVALIVLTRMKHIREYPRTEQAPGADGPGAPGHEEQPTADRRG